MKRVGAKVKIGAIDYPIYRADLSLRQLDGRIDYHACLIEIETTSAPDMFYDTLWHEIVHAILTNAGLDSPEMSTSVVASGVTQVLRDNPWIRRYYEKETK